MLSLTLSSLSPLTLLYMYNDIDGALTFRPRIYVAIQLIAGYLCNMWMYVVRVPYVCVHGTCGMNVPMCVHMCICAYVYVCMCISCVYQKINEKKNK